MKASQWPAKSKTLNCTHDFSQCVSYQPDPFGFGCGCLCFARHPHGPHQRPGCSVVGRAGMADARRGAGHHTAGRASALWFCNGHVCDRLAGRRRLCDREPDIPETPHALDTLRRGRSRRVGGPLFSRRPHARHRIGLAGGSSGIRRGLLRPVRHCSGPCLVYDPGRRAHPQCTGPEQRPAPFDAGAANLPFCGRWVCAAERHVIGRRAF